MIHLVAATLVALLTVEVANPVSTYLPTIIGPSLAIPSPYNIQAQAIVLQAGDMAAGFHLDKSEAVAIPDAVVAWGGVSAHKTQFSNGSPQLSELSKVESGAVVFLAVSGAKQAFDAEVAFDEQEPSYERVTAPSYGDETAAFRSVGTLNGQLVATYYLYFYKGNVWGAIRIEGDPDLTELENVEPYIQMMLEKIH